MMDFSTFSSPVLLRGDEVTAYRDPAVYYHDGIFHFFFTLVETEADGRVFLYLANCASGDLKHFSPVRKLSPRDQAKNFSSPGNVVFFNDRFYLCCQTYCRENGEKFGNANSRIWLMESGDLINWSEPYLLKVKGNDTAFADMGRMIDPYLVQNKDGEWYCFFKQKGVSFSRSRDLKNWEFCGNVPCGENVCIVPDGDLFRMWYSPRNGIGEMYSRDLLHWEDSGKIITLGQSMWRWAQGRLTAGMVLDLRNVPEIGKALMFFHGTGPEPESVIFDQYGCIGFAWSSDLENWDFVR